MMSAKISLGFGIGLIGLILGLGVVMTIYVMNGQKQSLSPEELANLEETLQTIDHRLEILEESSTPVVAAVSATTARTPINQAPKVELEALSGIGPARADAIMAARLISPFRDMDDLHTRVPKIPQSVLQEIESKITFETKQSE